VSDNKLVAETRTQFGKGAARKIRRDNKIPAVMYGHGSEPVHITLPGHQSMLALKQSNALLTIVIDGEEHPAPKGTFCRVAPPLLRTVRNDNEAPVQLLIVSAPTTSGYTDMGWA